MKSTATNQEIIISGISGSGKTEASKLMLAYLANACNNFRFMETGAEESKFDDSFEDEVSNSEDSADSDDEVKPPKGNNIFEQLNYLENKEIKK